MISPEQAWATLERSVTPLPAVLLPLRRASGLVLAAPVSARVSFPPAPVAAMDGYAVVAAQAQGQTLPVAFTAAAGAPPQPLPPFQCARIFTGAVLPTGADAVVAQEDVTREGEKVRFPASILPGENVRQEGEVFRQGEELLPAGSTLTPAAVAQAAAGGIARVSVVPRPRIALVVTGSELVRGRLRVGAVYDCNTPMLEAFAAHAGLSLTAKLHVPDDLSALVAAFQRALPEADLILTTGGVSVGDFDLVPEAVKALQGDVLFHKVSQQPGKPILAARFGGKYMLGLPGNPLAVLVGFRLYALPLARALAGGPFQETWQTWPLAAPISNRGKRVQFRPARVDTTGQALEVLPWLGSHDLKAAAQATHLVRLDAGFSGQAGDPVLAVALYRPV